MKLQAASSIQHQSNPIIKEDVSSLQVSVFVWFNIWQLIKNKKRLAKCTTALDASTRTIAELKNEKLEKELQIERLKKELKEAMTESSDLSQELDKLNKGKKKKLV